MRRAGAVALAAAFALIGCAGRPSTVPEAVSRLDDSMRTVVTLDRATVLARPVRRVTATGRDYAFMGPVEVVWQTEHRYYIWLALATTIDRESTGYEPPSSATLTLVVDGVPMSMSLAEWRDDLDQPPYEQSMPVHEIVAAETTQDQLMRVAAASSVEVHIGSEAGRTTRYRRWRGDWRHWGRLVDQYD